MTAPDQLPFHRPPREYPVRRPDGTWRWLRIFSSLLRDREGRVEAVLGMCSDVTELHRAMQELRGSERRFAQRIMKASRSSSSHSARTSASSIVTAHASPLLVA